MASPPPPPSATSPPSLASLSLASEPAIPTLSSTDAISPPPPPLIPRQTAPPIARRPPGPGVGVGNLRAGVRGVPGAPGGGGMKIPPSLQAKMAAMASRSSTSSSASSSSGTPAPTTPSLSFRPNAPAVAGRTAGAPAPRRRPNGLTLSAMGASASPSPSGSESESDGGLPRLNNGGMSPSFGGNATDTPFSNFSRIVDPSGRLNFASKAVLHADGVDFSSGASFKIKMDDFELFEELGKGNYGTVQKVWHKPTKVTMALKEIRLELDDSKLKTIITELDILHRATSPYIIDFYGAFFIESCVYYCMEFMDAGSLEKVAGCDVPEDVLSRITRCVVEGLKFLKDDLKIMHRDVKPSNILINRKGIVKLCDFGVSGQLDRSLAKTNIGCQSYMAPERIQGESQGAATSYKASSDVWSLGLSMIEFAIGAYPYPPETYSNVFAQLTAIVHGDPPCLPERYSEIARDFVAKCLEKVAHVRPTYGELLEHPFLKVDVGRDVDVIGWLAGALEYREKNPRPTQLALA
ncbi:mitogen-activated protein kinase kinase, partial [Phenoliferia sp. Uapishka_3]